MLNVIHRYTFRIYAFYLMYMNKLFFSFFSFFLSEKGSVGFTSLSKVAMAQKRFRISGLNIVAWLSLSRLVWMVWLGVW